MMLNTVVAMAAGMSAGYLTSQMDLPVVVGLVLSGLVSFVVTYLMLMLLNK